MGVIGLIETYRVGSVGDKSHEVTVSDIKRIKYHKYASCNLICECKHHFAPISAFTSGI